MINILFFLGIVLIPFSGIPGLSFLGETKNEASVYIFLPMLIMALPLLVMRVAAEDAPVASFQLLNKITFAIVGVIVISFGINSFSILNTIYLGRHGLEKFLTSNMIIAYGLMLAYFSYTISQNNLRFLLIIPVALSAALCCLYSFFELTAQYINFSLVVAEKVSSIIHFAPGVPSDRIRSLAYEPPALATYAAFAWPWLYAGMKTSNGLQKILFAALWIAITLLPLMAISRTGYLNVFSSLIGLLLLNTVFLSKPPKPISFQRIILWAIVLISVIIGLMVVTFFEDIKHSVINGNNVSNLSRLASNVAAFSMMSEKPFLGFGLGQYGFHASDHMPTWGFMSWEIQKWFTIGASKTWPPVFSIYARFGAELGFIGVTGWVALWAGLAYSILRLSQALYYQKGKIPNYAKPLVLSCIAVLFVGIPSDSLRAPMIWITLGLSCRFIYDAKKELLMHDGVVDEAKNKSYALKMPSSPIINTKKISKEKLLK